MKKTIIILLIVMMMPVMLLWASGSRTTNQTGQVPKNSAKAIGGIVNSSASIIIQDGAYVVVSGAGDFLSQGSGNTGGDGTLILTGDVVNENTSGSPFSSQGSVIFSGVSTQNISGNLITFGNLVLNNTQGLNVDCPTQIEGGLQISSGNVNMTVDNNIWLNNKDIAFRGANSITAITVNLVGEPGTYGSNVSINKKWNITGQTTGEVQVTMRWINAENNGNNFSSGQAKIWHFNTNWLLIGSYPIVIDGVYNTVTFPWTFGGKNGAGDFTLTGEDQTLPVELSSFTAILNAESFVNLTWVTQSETDMNGFVIYRSETETLSNACAVSAMIPASNSSNETVYNYQDSEVEDNTTYSYWLSSVELSGDVSFYGPVRILVNNDDGDVPPPETPLKTGITNVFPNPFNPHTIIAYSLKKQANTEVTVYNSKGQLIRRLVSEAKGAGLHRIGWDGKDTQGREVSGGVYYVRLTADGIHHSKKIILLK